METENLLMVVAVIAVVVSIVGAGITYNAITNFKNIMTGFATDNATINLTVSSTAIVNFTTDNINWGTGSVTPGQDNATLYTGDNSAGNVTNGNWTGNTDGLVLKNIGNVNVTINLKTASTAAGFVGGSAGGGPDYEYNVTNVDSNACYNASTFALGQLYDVNITNDGTRVCDKLIPDKSIRIDIKLVVPSDSKTGALGDVMTATYASA